MDNANTPQVFALVDGHKTQPTPCAYPVVTASTSEAISSKSQPPRPSSPPAPDETDETDETAETMAFHIGAYDDRGGVVGQVKPPRSWQ